MMTANYLLLALGVFGVADVLFYHSISHGIRTHRESCWELVTHALRGPTYAILFLIVPNYEVRGAFAVMLALLLVFDVGISVADFWLERTSRAELGGLPSGEYVLHMIMAMLFGAFVMAVAPTLIEWTRGASRIVVDAALAPVWVRCVLATFAVGVFVSGFMDLLAVFRLMISKPVVARITS